MIKRWSIEPAPTARDSRRRRLFLHAALSDVQGLIRKFGSLCGRPKKEGGHSHWTYSLGLSAADEGAVEALRAELSALCPAEGAAGAAKAPEAAAAVKLEPSAPKTPPVKLEPPTTNAAPVPAPADLGLVSLFDDAPAGLTSAGAASPPPAATPAPMSEPAKAAPPAETKSGMPPIRLRTEPPKPIEPPKEAPASWSVVPPKAASPSAVPAPAAVRGAPIPAGPALSAACVEPRADMSFDNLLVGSFNRFSHAAAASAASNPGELYNPIFLSGGPGTGKTHLLNAVARQLAGQYPGEKIWLTSGGRLAAAAAAAETNGRSGELEALARDARALLIDDAHLMEFNDSNRALIVKIVHAFMDGRRQVMMTSAYPARLLGALEQALQLRFSSGWTGDLKPPAGDQQVEVLRRLFQKTGFDISFEDANGLCTRLGGTLAEASLLARRLFRMQELLTQAQQPVALQDMVNAVMAAPTAAPPIPEEVQAVLAAKTLLLDGPEAAALCFPVGLEDYARFGLRRVQDTARQNGWPCPLKVGPLCIYDPSQVFGTPYVVAGALRAAGARTALLVGPPPGSDLAQREDEFHYAVGHLSADAGVALGWLPLSLLNDPGTVFRAYLDVSEALR
ncbi:MAG: DnaA/Hda family protein [Elusimicrobiota bacterium]|jgi:hypothetical protein